MFMKIEITLEEGILLAGMKKMRQIAKSQAKIGEKEIAINTVFEETMRILDQKGFDE